MRMYRLLLILGSLLWLIGCTSTTTVTSKDDPFAPLATKGRLQVIFLDVGQGSSQLIVSPSGKAMLIDAGNNDKEQTMLDYLKKFGIERLDIVIGTHPDADHIGGLDKVIDRTEIGKIYLPKASSNTKTFESLLESIQRKKLKVSTAKAGLSLNWDDSVHVDMIAPVKTYEDSNNMSAVVRITYGKTSFLLTGDAETQSEKDMMEAGPELSSTVLGVGHHGSGSSTSLSFLKKVSPRYAVIQVGKDNKYGHPVQAVLDRLDKAGVQVYRNDRNGTIAFVSDGEDISIATERQAKP